jgi:hypothetical protein
MAPRTDRSLSGVANQRSKSLVQEIVPISLAMIHRAPCWRPHCSRNSWYGIDAKLFAADCPRTIAKNMYDACGAKCPDLSKVV